VSTIGGADTDKLQAARKHVTGLPGVPSGTADAFLRQLAKHCVRPWLEKMGGASAPTAVVFCEEAKSLRQTLDLERYSAIQQSDPKNLVGRVLFCGASVSHGWVAKEPVGSANDVEQLLEKGGLSDRCFVLLTPKDGTAFAYPKGYSDASPTFPLVLSGVVISVEPGAVDDELKRFHAQVESPHPNVFPKLWHDGVKYVPIERTEKTIQGALALWFYSASGSVAVVREKPNKYGYSDIILSQVLDGNESGNRGVVELKVLRHKHYHEDAGKASLCASSVNDAAVSEGLKQAIAYTKDEGAAFAFACYYDMREKDNPSTLDTPEVKSAEKLGVFPRRYFLFSTVERARDGLVSALGGT
jgi:hypothetical protein